MQHARDRNERDRIRSRSVAQCGMAELVSCHARCESAWVRRRDAMISGKCVLGRGGPLCLSVWQRDYVYQAVKRTDVVLESFEVCM